MNVQHSIDEFKRAWAAAERPRIEDFVNALGTEREQEVFCSAIDVYLTDASTPPYSPAQIEEIVQEMKDAGLDLDALARKIIE